MVNLKAGDIVQCIDTKGLFKLTMGSAYTVFLSTPINSLIVYDDTGASIVLVNDLGREMSNAKQFVVMNSVSGNPNSGVQPTTYVYKPGDQLLCVRPFGNYPFTINKFYTTYKDMNGGTGLYVVCDKGQKWGIFTNTGEINLNSPAGLQFVPAPPNIYKPGDQVICVKTFPAYDFTVGNVYTVKGGSSNPYTMYIVGDTNSSLYCFLSSGEIDPSTSAYEMFQLWQTHSNGISVHCNPVFNNAQTQLIPRKGYSSGTYGMLKAEKEAKKYSFSVEQKDMGHNASHEVITNWALGKQFLYCRNCSKEVTVDGRVI